MILRVLALAGVWVALWGEPSPANILWGVVLALLLVWFFPNRRGSMATFRPLAVLRLTAHMFVALVTSSWNVALAVLRPTPERTEAREIRVNLATHSPMVVSVLTNSINLTPGTIVTTCDDDAGALVVHVLGHVEDDEFVAQIRGLERMVAAALGVPLEEGSQG